jgi:hypothetical protein
LFLGHNSHTQIIAGRNLLALVTELKEIISAKVLRHFRLNARASAVAASSRNNNIQSPQRA